MAKGPSSTVKSSDVQAMTWLVHEKIIKTGRLGGVPNELIAAAVTINDKRLFKVYEFYKLYVGKFGTHIFIHGKKIIFEIC